MGRKLLSIYDPFFFTSVHVALLSCGLVSSTYVHVWPVSSCSYLGVSQPWTPHWPARRYARCSLTTLWRITDVSTSIRHQLYRTMTPHLFTNAGMNQVDSPPPLSFASLIPQPFEKWVKGCIWGWGHSFASFPNLSHAPSTHRHTSTEPLTPVTNYNPLRPQQHSIVYMYMYTVCNLHTLPVIHIQSPWKLLLSAVIITFSTS